MSSNKHFIDSLLQGPPEIKQFEMCSHFRTKDGTCYECRLESECYQLRTERDQLKKALKDALKLMDNKFYGLAHKNIAEALGEGRDEA
ncbi:hypothetical protein MKX33_00680 [Paenibacillus sp. FSL R5-0490]|uniref:hypothetical protein n=1 Tax=Paenibacillus sp. FSL R5-0490 TaxID=1920424 RepID=UPI0030D128E9